MQEGKRPKGLPHLAAIKSSSSRTILEMVLIRCPIYFFLLFFSWGGEGENAGILLLAHTVVIEGHQISQCRGGIYVQENSYCKNL